MGNGESDIGIGLDPGIFVRTGFHAHGSPFSSSQSSWVHRSGSGKRRNVRALTTPSGVIIKTSFDRGRPDPAIPAKGPLTLEFVHLPPVRDGHEHNSFAEVYKFTAITFALHPFIGRFAISRHLEAAEEKSGTLRNPSHQRVIVPKNKLRFLF